MLDRPSGAGPRAWRTFVASYATVIDPLERELVAARGIPPSWYEVLLRVSEAPIGGVRMQELARGVFLSKSGLTQVVTRMEAAGLIRREVCPSDRRGINAVLTPEGKRALKRAAAIHLRGIERHFAGPLHDPGLCHIAAAFGQGVEAQAP